MTSAVWAAPAPGGPFGAAPALRGAAPGNTIRYHETGLPAPESPKVRAMLALRAEGVKLRKADGGTLTPEHVAYLQTKLDAIHAKMP
ncbi:MAG TPA: hypothetical protein VGO53_03580 [Steroidobacteraceae bacterium]|nr:hypothetical protein [Steroidobacteraceae bacterium]